jgi:hypothetical protein
VSPRSGLNATEMRHIGIKGLNVKSGTVADFPKISDLLSNSLIF